MPFRAAIMVMVPMSEASREKTCKQEAKSRRAVYPHPSLSRLIPRAPRARLQNDRELKGDVTRDDSQRRFLAQHSVATLFQHCNANTYQYSFPVWWVELPPQELVPLDLQVCGSCVCSVLLEDLPKVYRWFLTFRVHHVIATN